MTRQQITTYVQNSQILPKPNPLWNTTRQLIIYEQNLLNLGPTFARLNGMLPENLLLAKFITEAGEFPKFEGICPSNWLLFRKMASSLVSKIASGIGPEKLLNLRSKNSRFGMRRDGLGNRPENWLLLRSNSVRKGRSLKVSGITPVNLLLFRWRRDMSDERQFFDQNALEICMV